MPRLMRFRYNRQACEEAWKKGLPMPGPESVEDLGEAEYDEYALEQLAKMFYHRMKNSERRDAT